MPETDNARPFGRNRFERVPLDRLSHGDRILVRGHLAEFHGATPLDGGVRVHTHGDDITVTAATALRLRPQIESVELPDWAAKESN